MHLLIVEDDLDLGAALQRGLRADGVTSEWFRRIADAAHAFEASAFDCVLLDLMLPDGSGMDLLRQWRNGGVGVPVIVITARSALEERLEGLDAGADDFLVKPFATEELLSRLRAVVRRAARQSSDRWDFGDLCIEPRSHRASIDGCLLDLSLREFAVLLELAKVRGEVLAKSALAKRLNPLGDPLDSGAVEVHVSNLRRKIGAQRICTVRGVGYMLSS